MQRVKDEEAARKRAAIALKEARQSVGPRGMADAAPRETAKERAARALREARQSAGPRGMADDGL
jgi:hypothetical protein